MRNSFRCVAAFLSISLCGWLVGCARHVQHEVDPADVTLSGAELEYVFENGRRYRARYGEATVHFELLSPVLPDPPSETLSYRVQAIRDGVYLVAWEGFEYQPVFVIDLVERKVHTRAVREDGDVLFLTAKIVSLEYPQVEP